MATYEHEEIQLRPSEPSTGRLLSDSRLSGVIPAPPSYEDQVKDGAAGKSFTLPHGLYSPREDEWPKMRASHRASSLPDVKQLTLSRGNVATYRTLPRLKERIQSRKDRIPASSTVWLNLEHIWWPKLSRKMVSALTVELWKSDIKHVESRFGTAVASYFVLLRWLFYMNLAIFGVWLLFVLLPQFAVEPTLTAQRSANLHCVSPNTSYKCYQPSNTTVYIAFGTCSRAPKGSLTARMCTEDQNLTVTAIPETANRTKNENCHYNATKYLLCSNHTPRYNDPIDLITGRGGYNDTWLFLGHYVNYVTPYNRPVAYLVCTALVYGISFIMLIVSLGKAYVDNTVKFSSLIKANFCNKVFSAWDYKITNAKAVRLKKAFIRTDLQEELIEHTKQSNNRKSREFLKVVLIRIFTNFLVLALMVGCGACIVVATGFSWKQLVQQNLNAIGLIVPILIIASIIILPIIFHVIANFEQYKTQSGHEKMTLIRSSTVRIFTLLVYIVAAYAAIECTQSTDIQVAALNTFKNGSTYCVDSCWETFIGQQFYNLLILEYIFVSIFTVVYESLRHGLFRAFHKKVEHKILKSIFSKASFSISDSVNDLVYYQLLMWLGFFFSPVLPFFQVIILFTTFYIKKYSLIFNLEPEKGALFRGSRAMFISTCVFLVVLAGSVFPVGYAVARFRPSEECGPFRNKESFLTVLNEVISASSSSSQEFLHYIGSSGFVVPFIMVLIAIICMLSAVIVAKKRLLRISIAHLDAEGIALLHTDEAVVPMLAQLRHQSSATQMTPEYNNKT